MLTRRHFSTAMLATAGAAFAGGPALAQAYPAFVRSESGKYRDLIKATGVTAQ